MEKLFSMIDWTISFGNILQMFAILAGGLAMFFTMRADIRIIRHDVKHIETGQKILNEAFAQLGTILTQVAVQDTRLGMIERAVDDLRHGQGFVRLIDRQKE